MKIDKKISARIIKELQKHTGWSIDEIAQKLGVHRRTVYRYLSASNSMGRHPAYLAIKLLKKYRLLADLNLEA
jgi:AraC-like DNA-binding protein